MSTSLFLLFHLVSVVAVVGFYRRALARHRAMPENHAMPDVNEPPEGLSPGVARMLWSELAYDSTYPFVLLFGLAARGGVALTEVEGQLRMSPVRGGAPSLFDDETALEEAVFDSHEDDAVVRASLGRLEAPAMLIWAKWVLKRKLKPWWGSASGPWWLGVAGLAALTVVAVSRHDDGTVTRAVVGSFLLLWGHLLAAFSAGLFTVRTLPGDNSVPGGLKLMGKVFRAGLLVVLWGASTLVFAFWGLGLGLEVGLAFVAAFSVPTYFRGLREKRPNAHGKACLVQLKALKARFEGDLKPVLEAMTVEDLGAHEAGRLMAYVLAVDAAPAGLLRFLRR